MTAKATTPQASLPTLVPSSIITSAGVGADTTARTSVPMSTTSHLAAPSMLFLAINGVPQVRISGATPEETVKNKDLQAMGLLDGKNNLVSFDMKNGEIRGIRMDGEMYARMTAAGKG